MDIQALNRKFRSCLDELKQRHYEEADISFSSSVQDGVAAGIPQNDLIQCLVEFGYQYDCVLFDVLNGKKRFATMEFIASSKQTYMYTYQYFRESAILCAPLLAQLVADDMTNLEMKLKDLENTKIFMDFARAACYESCMYPEVFAEFVRIIPISMNEDLFTNYGTSLLKGVLDSRYCPIYMVRLILDEYKRRGITDMNCERLEVNLEKRTRGDYVVLRPNNEWLPSPLDPKRTKNFKNLPFNPLLMAIRRNLGLDYLQIIFTLCVPNMTPHQLASTFNPYPPPLMPKRGWPVVSENMKVIPNSVYPDITEDVPLTIEIAIHNKCSLDVLKFLLEKLPSSKWYTSHMRYFKYFRQTPVCMSNWGPPQPIVDVEKTYQSILITAIRNRAAASIVEYLAYQALEKNVLSETDIKHVICEGIRYFASPKLLMEFLDKLKKCSLTIALEIWEYLTLPHKEGSLPIALEILEHLTLQHSDAVEEEFDDENESDGPKREDKFATSAYIQSKQYDQYPLCNSLPFSNAYFRTETYEAPPSSFPTTISIDQVEKMISFIPMPKDIPEDYTAKSPSDWWEHSHLFLSISDDEQTWWESMTSVLMEIIQSIPPKKIKNFFLSKHGKPMMFIARCPHWPLNLFQAIEKPLLSAMSFAIKCGRYDPNVLRCIARFAGRANNYALIKVMAQEGFTLWGRVSDYDSTALTCIFCHTPEKVRQMIVKPKDRSPNRFQWIDIVDHCQPFVLNLCYDGLVLDRENSARWFAVQLFFQSLLNAKNHSDMICRVLDFPDNGIHKLLDLITAKPWKENTIELLDIVIKYCQTKQVELKDILTVTKDVALMRCVMTKHNLAANLTHMFYSLDNYDELVLKEICCFEALSWIGYEEYEGTADACNALKTIHNELKAIRTIKKMK
eukprot:TRINITY_DN5209_c1_g1_i1.p1 TRINITY_DN5209_c1_g1~~TRINITY_DN5209_c1_g1_i1.p1  ORF type:complete len:902 (-),score=96.96 TRINITY_DN5209_c1_g1_i1:159-2864(-)